VANHDQAAWIAVASGFAIGMLAMYIALHVYNWK
jgi:hypothetical protein